MESGRLEDESTASLCRRLAEESRTGCLHLVGHVGDTRPDVRIYLREGRLHTARSSGGGRLGDRLVGGGHLTAAQLDSALRARAAEPEAVRLGHVLVRGGLVDRDVLAAVLREQVLDAVSVPLGWSAGEWRFVDGEAVTEEYPLGMGVQDALMEGARRLGELAAIQAHMGSMDTVVDFPSTGNSARLSLKPDEWAMLTHIDGQTTVAEIADLAGYSELEAARIIYGLLSAGVVRKVEDLTPPAPPVPLPSRDAAPAGDAPPAPLLTRPTSRPVGADDPLAELESLGQLAASRPANPWMAAPAPPAAGPPHAEEGTQGTPSRKGLLDRIRRR